MWVARPEFSMGLRLARYSAQVRPLATTARLERLRARLLARRASRRAQRLLRE